MVKTLVNILHNYKPFVKRVGWKRQLLPVFRRIYPKFFNRYFEPFVWWGAVFFDLRNIYWIEFTAYLFDINDELINTYNVIKFQVYDLVEELKNYPYDKEFYYKIRNLDRDPSFKNLNPVKRAARFIYLNRTCYNWLWRVNSKWQFNVPFGRYKNPLICDEENLIAVSKALQNTIIKNIDFTEVLKYAEKGDFIYFDPPYDVLTQTANFTNYTSWWFTRQDQIKLAEVFRELDKRWCFVMLSNHNTEFIRNLYKDYRIDIVWAKRAVNSKAEGRKGVEEVVVRNF